MDTVTEDVFDDLTKLIAYICETPVALVSLVDRDRQWFKSKTGLDINETAKDYSFCAHALCDQDSVMVVSDASQDERFIGNPLVTSKPGIRFYAGTPLVSSDGYALGTLCVIDYVPRELTFQQLDALKALGRQVVTQIEAKHQLKLLQATQAQIIQSSKMTALRKLAAGIAHEINNPNTFIYGNLEYLSEYIQTLLRLINTCQDHLSSLPPAFLDVLKTIDLDFVEDDLWSIFKSIQNGSQRIQKIVQSVGTFASLDEEGPKQIDVHRSLEVTLESLGFRLKGAAISVQQEYGNVALINGYSRAVNQVFFNLLDNAIDALERSSKEEKIIKIQTRMLDDDNVVISVTDNGVGISKDNQSRVFDPFFTTKKTGTGTGTGLFVSHQIISEQHGGRLYCSSQPNEETTFVIELPIEHLSILD
ncbi:ATP-binding protein [Oscillatoria sp. CS-180]|uniref:ATP-binding protein n=1 Tax=Oscillatoria sp. CS-180 TaxID=3021720 RepID=UPI00232E0720|nr:ATP-binding protein [Oscillatoria sp. CS-180]MDB9526685.1 ATP-binding protein [Oscillatoria sp. CS-180]